ncbi:MAG: EAL domain-containing protein [Campylobacterota bacterium]|nr:EAL domain-containing protein [Campylobacterota bacterium]
MTNTNISFITIDELKNSLANHTLVDSSQTLIQLFCANTDIEFIKKIQLLFNDEFPKSVLVGTTTDGIIENSNVFNDIKSIVSITTFKNTSLKSLLIEHSYNSFNTGKVLAKSICNDDTKVIISFLDGIHSNGEEYVKGINDISPSVVLSGGLSADNGNMVETYIFDKDNIVTNGAIGVSLSGNSLNVTTNYNFDWMPIGKKLKVTKAIKNRIYEIDGISAVDTYAKYMGKDLAEKLPQIGIEFPLIFEEDGVSVGRAVLFKHDDGSLTFAGNIKEGELVRFGVGNIETILRNNNYHTKSFLERLKYETEAIFVYSCMARRRFMNEYTEMELKSLASIGNVSGFFTYGEFFHSQSSKQLLNETMTILALSEEKNPLNINIEEIITKQEFEINSGHVLAHLANTVSNELAELNDNLEQRVKDSLDYIYKQAYYDELTGFSNRLSLIKELRSFLGKVLFLINIDDFTTINDFYGLAIGDKVLKQLANALKNMTINSEAEVFKLPSDEFAIVMPIDYSVACIEQKVKEIISAVEEEEFLLNGHNTHVTVTVSAAFIKDSSTCFANADMSLKLAKKAGKDYMIYSEDMKLSKQYKNNITMANTIKDAISSDNIIPYYQPIFCAKTGKVEKYESLVRLRNSEGKILSPFFFLDISQKIKLYSYITEIMIEKTFSFFGENGLNFSVNLAIVDILNEKTRKFIFDKISEYNIAKQLTIEIIETQEIENEDSIHSFIDDVYTCGAKIAIDDFGSGFANFEHMTKIRSDYMKIDGSLIKNIDTDSDARMVIETIVIFAKKLRKKTVAEFVSSKEIYDIVKELDIDYIQGYYVGEPNNDIIK